MSLFKKWSYKIIEKVENRTKTKLSKKEKDSIVNINYKIYMYVWFTARSILFVYLFSSVIFKRIGFEKTVIVLLAIIMMVLWFTKKIK